MADEIKTDPLIELVGGGIIPTPEQVQVEAERKTAFGRTLADVKPLVAESEDPNVLFRNNWLSRGQVVSLVASTGVGKSAMSMQTAINWAAGLPFLAEPVRPLKCAVIQAEDSERDVAEQLAGMKKGLLLNGWTEGKFNETISNILYPSVFLGKQGNDFIRLLAEFQGDTKCDMIFINPVQAFFGGDISAQKDVSAWARGGIDPIIKSEDHGCGVFLVMHTAKITSGNKEGRVNVDDYGEYIGAGSHEWIDWVRAQLVFLKHNKSDTYFDLKAAKRGARIGWRDEDDEKVTKKLFKHSDGFIFWQEVVDEEEIANIDNIQPAKSRKIGEDEAKEIAERMVAWIKKHRAVKKTELTETDNTAFKGMGLTRAQRRAGGKIIRDRFADFGLTCNADGFGNAEGLRVLSHQMYEERRIEQMKRENTATTPPREATPTLGSGRADTLPPPPQENAPAPLPVGEKADDGEDNDEEYDEDDNPWGVKGL